MINIPAAKKAVLLWEIRLLSIAMVIALLSGILLALFGIVVIFIPIAAFSVIIFFSLFVTPKYFKSFQCKLTQNEITIISGCLKIKQRTIPLSCIQFAELTTMPLEKLLKIASITIYLAGAKTRINGLASDKAHFLLHKLKEGYINEG